LKKRENILNDGITYLRENSSSIDILYVLGIYNETLSWIRTYKSLNPKGKVYLKLDANVWWMNRIELDKEALRVLKECNVISVECKRLYMYLNKKWPLKIEYIPNGFYNFYENSRVEYKEKENVILTVGRLGTRQKATEILLEAFKLAASHIPNWKLKLIGGVEKQFKLYIDNFISENPLLEKRIIFTGPITDRATLEKEYRKAKIFCLTSRIEGFPLVFPEAAINGCFIVSTNLDPAYDITDEERYGRLFAIDDFQKLSQIFIDVCKMRKMSIYIFIRI
jgi:GalNAc-alpha-(1->4)-GalNAc-alpha-(1->3)-diNAcBac-PP-undecaprenol alpha-1,4-N-acetyl-D-galactosaminyltransferase